jgi:hypothetical protein
MVEPDKADEITVYADCYQLKELSEALLDFENVGDLTDWLRNLEGGEQG